MNKLECDREQLLEVWNKSFGIVQQMTPFLQKPAEYYYHSGVCDACKLLIGEKQLVDKQ